MISSSVALDECCHMPPCSLCKAGFGGLGGDGGAGGGSPGWGGREAGGEEPGSLGQSLCLAAFAFWELQGDPATGAVLGPRSPAESIRGGQ